MTSDILALVLRLNLVAAAAILLVLVLRPMVMRRFGAQVGYALWAVVPLAAAASLLPARRIVAEAGSALADLAQAAAAPSSLPVPAEAGAAAFDPASWILAAWAVGAVACFAVLSLRQHRFCRSLGRLTPEGGVYRARSPGVGPVLAGVLRPRIIVPADFEARFAADERTVVLAHEETHRRRGDPLVNTAVAGARCLCWFNPLVHVGAFFLRLDQELACDAEVLARFPGARRRYAEAMLKTQVAPLAVPLACHWPARSVRLMKRRIAMLKAPPPDAGRRAAGLVLVGLAALGAGVGAWAAQPARIETVVRAPPAVPPHAAQLGAGLLEAVEEGHRDAIEALIEAGADVDHYRPGDGTPLLAAARLGDLRTARRLLDEGAAVNKPAPGDGTPLIAAAAHGRLEMVRLLIAAGADVNQYVRYDETPLINAARHGDIAMVRHLIDHGADPNLAVPSGNWPGEMRSPLSMAANPLVGEYLKSRGARR